jgi:CTP:phosphocholine cytidylyltransferase-like protein
LSLYKEQNKLDRIVNQTKVSSYRREPFWKFGVLVPRTHKQAMELDMKNNKWQDSEATEMNQLLEYQTFLIKGKEVRRQ